MRMIRFIMKYIFIIYLFDIVDVIITIYNLTKSRLLLFRTN